jgi:8-oxo-dGTP diphosphatase
LAYIIRMASPERPQVVLVNRCAIQNDAEEFLLLQRAANDHYAPGKWEFPGGKLDIGQHLSEALLREVEEETGLIIEPASPLVYPESFLLTEGKYAGLAYVVLFSLGRVASGTLRLSEEHDAYAWKKYDEALKYDITSETEQALRVFGATLLRNC